MRGFGRAASVRLCEGLPDVDHREEREDERLEDRDHQAEETGDEDRHPGAILDLSANGAQPMLSEDGRVGLVFNGAIYNFPELRRQLEAAGFRVITKQESQVIALALRNSGGSPLMDST